MKTLLQIFILISLHLSVNGQEIMKGRAINIYDGDTFTLLEADGSKTKIRIVGIDAPEKDQIYGIESRDYARSLLNDRNVTVYLEPGETYGRKLGVVITDQGKHFNYEMVASGHAWFYDYYSDDKFLEAAFKKAKEKKIGLWSAKDPVAPWDYRRNNN